MLIKSALLLTASAALGLGQSCNWQDLQLSWPVKLDPAVRPGYGNLKGLFYTTNYTGFINPADPNGPLINYTGVTPGHNGIDIRLYSYRQTQDSGAKVYAAAAGSLLVARDGIFDHMGGQADPNAYKLYPPLDIGGVEDGSGNVVYLYHANGFVTQYAHLRMGLEVTKNYKNGEIVPEGTLLGIAASSGASSYPHLHFGVYAGPECSATTSVVVPGGRVSSKRWPVWGYLVDPLKPLSGATMFKGTQGVDYPFFDHCFSAPQLDFQDLGVSVTDGHSASPPVDQLIAPLGGQVKLLAGGCGDPASGAMRITSPTGSTSFINGWREPSFRADVPGVWKAEIGTNPGPNFNSRIQRQVTVLPQLPTRVFQGTINGTLWGSGTTGTRTADFSIAFAGDTAAGEQLKVIATFDTLGLPANATIRHARLRFTVVSIDGVNPTRGTGWGGRIFGDLRSNYFSGNQALELSDFAEGSGPGFLAQAAEFARVDPGLWGAEAVLSPAALTLLQSSRISQMRIYFEVPTNKDAVTDQIGFMNPELLVTYELPSGTVEANPPPRQPINLAVGKTTNQSSMAYGGSPGRAVDGNTSGNWYDGAVTHTNVPATEAQPFWELDLGRLYDVQTIRIWGRTDCCQERNADLSVCVSAQSPQDETCYPQKAFQRSSVVMPSRTGIRYVRVQSGGNLPAANRVISLAEVEVLGYPKTPVLSSLATTPASPTSLQAFTLTLNGSGFEPALAQIRILGPAVNFTFPNSQLTTKALTQLAASLPFPLPFADYSVTASNSAGYESNSLPFTVIPPAPVVNGVSTSPGLVLAGQPFTLTVTGLAFDPATAEVVIANVGSFANSVLTSKSATQLSLPLTIASAGTFNVSVRNGPNGSSYNSVPLIIQAPLAPSLTSVGTVPSPAITDQQFNLTVNGQGFDPAMVQVQIANLGTFVNSAIPSKSATQLILPVTISAAGSYNVTARNGASGTASNGLTVTVNAAPPPTPALTSLSTAPSPVTVGQQFTLTIAGTGFDPATAQVEIGGVGTIANAAITSKSATQLILPVTIGGAGAYTVTVRNGSGGTASNGLGITVNAVPPPPGPVLSTVTTAPSPALTGQQFTLTVAGTGFDPATVQVDIANVGTFANSAIASKSSTQLVLPVTIASAGTYTVTARNGSAGTVSNGLALTVNPAAASGSHFVPIAPCRAADTRNTTILAAQSTRDFTFGPCNIPANATALALNVTIVPQGSLGYISVWPVGQSQPLVSTMNSLDGRIKANAAIVGTGTNGGVSIFVTNPTHVILDVNGYFVPAGTPGALAFYPVTPCRVFDSRSTTILGIQETRRISGGCLPAQAQAYSLNMTVVPTGLLGFLTIWPDGAQPVVSTLNAVTGTIVANAAIIRAGSGGGFNAFVTNQTHLIADLNGYFAPPGSPGALAFYPLPPCRMNDTRNANGPFGGPRMEGDAARDYTVPSSSCGVPASAQAFVLNATIVPPGSFGFLTLWPGGQDRPTVSTLNAIDGALTSNAAIVAAGPGGVVRTYALNPTHLLMDISGFFAP